MQERLIEYSRFGGTQMHCPSCNKIKMCESINYKEFSNSEFRRFYSSEIDSINWFARARECRACFCVFETAEVPKKILSEFISIKRSLAKQSSIKELYRAGKLVSLKKHQGRNPE